MGVLVQPSIVKVRVINPGAHWDRSISHGDRRYEFETDAAGNTFVIVPLEVAALLHNRVAGYEIADT